MDYRLYEFEMEEQAGEMRGDNQIITLMIDGQAENKKQELIEVWRPHDLAQLELRRGIADTRPVPRHWHEEYQPCLVQAGEGELKYPGRDLPTLPACLFR